MLCAESVRTAHNTHFTTNQWADDYVRFELEMKSSGKITISALYECFFSGLDCVYYFMFYVCVPFAVAECVCVRALSDQYINF